MPVTFLLSIGSPRSHEFRVCSQGAGWLDKTGSSFRRYLSCIVINSEKATFLHVISELARLTEVLAEIAEISASQDVNFPYEALQPSQPGRPAGIKVCVHLEPKGMCNQPKSL